MVLDLLERDQEVGDLLPPGSPALLVTVPGSSRSLGGTDAHWFFVARGIATEFCVVAVDVYGVELGHACGGASFGGELAEGLRFEFGAFFAKPIPRAEWSVSLGPHFVYSLEMDADEWSDEFEALVSRPQVDSDIPPGASEGGGLQSVDSFRLLTVDGATSYFVAFASRPGAVVCLTSRTEGEGGTAWGSGSCGVQDVVLTSGFSAAGEYGSLRAHFRPAGFEGETPTGWRQVTPLLRVQDPDAPAQGQGQGQGQAQGRVGRGAPD